MTTHPGQTPEPANDIPDMEPPSAPDILPGDPEGLKPVNEPERERDKIGGL